MSEDKAKSEAMEASVTPRNSISIEEIQEVFQQRNDALVTAFNKEINVANRYDLKTRLEELSTIFNALMNLK